MIVFPRDWQRLDTDRLGVVFNREIPRGCQSTCVMWPAKDYQEIPDWRQRETLATAYLHKEKEGLHVFFFKDLKYSGTCVLSVIIFSDPPGFYDSGVQILPSRVSTVTLHDKRLATRVVDDIRFPLVDVWTNHSNYQRSPLNYDGQVEMVEFDRLTDHFREAPETSGKIKMAICHQSETHDASSALLVQYCHGLERLPKGYSSTWTAAEAYYVLLPQVTAGVASGHILFEDRYRWGDACPSPDLCDPETTSLEGAFRVDGRRGIVDMRRWEFRGKNAIPMQVSNGGRFNHGHWLQNSVMAMFFLREAINAGKILPVALSLTERQLRPLELIGITRDKILEVDEQSVFFPKIIYPSFVSTHPTNSPGKWALQCYKIIRERVSRDFAEIPPEYIYFTRIGYTGFRRGMDNEQELIDMLQSIGFQIIAPHENTFDLNVYLVSQAKVIVSQFGAALVDIAFAPKQCVVIELICDCYFNNDFLYSTYLYDQKLIRIVSSAIPGTQQSPDGFRFLVPIDKVRQAALAAMDIWATKM